MNELELLRNNAFAVMKLQHAEDAEIVELDKQAQALHESISQPLEEINKKMQNYLASCMSNTLQCRLQLNQEKE